MILVKIKFLFTYLNVQTKKINYSLLSFYGPLIVNLIKCYYQLINQNNIINGAYTIKFK